MRSVSGQTHLDSQVIALRSTALSLLHRKAIFDYLRYREITGRKRHRFFTVFYGSRDYVNAVLSRAWASTCAAARAICARSTWPNT